MQEVDLEKFLGAIVSTQVRTDHLHKTYITLKFWGLGTYLPTPAGDFGSNKRLT